MAKNKTTETTNSVSDFISSIADATKRNDCLKLLEIIGKQTGHEPKMWGPAIIGFGSYHYKYESGREGDSPLVGFSPRAAALSLYLCGSFEQRDELLAKLGKHKTDKGCIQIKKLDDVDTAVLKQMISNHIKQMKKTYSEK